jgi:hypothetical protein
MPQEKMTMDQVRERFPEYDDMDDMELANAIHGRFYSDMPLGEFYAQVGFNPDQDAGDNQIYPEMRPGFSQDNPIDLTAIDRSTPEGQALVTQLTRGTWVKGADGTVYALPQDAREGVVSVGDEPLSQGLVQRPFSAVEDVAKSFPTGVVEGLTGLAGMQGTIAQMAGGQPGQYLPGYGIVGPSGEQLNEGVRDLIGRDYYQPQSVAGEYSRTVGEFLPGALAPGGVGARAASVLVPAATSETAGQIARGMSGGQRDTAAEEWSRLVGGLGGGLVAGGVNTFRSGGETALQNAAPNVTPRQLQLADEIKRQAAALGINMSNANALQQATGGATGLGRLQRVVEGQTPRMNEFFAAIPGQVERAIANELDRIGPSVEPSALAGRSQEAATGVLDTMRRRVNESAQPFYDQLPGQTLDPADLARLQANPSYSAASEQLMGNPELAALVGGGPEDLSTVNRVIQQLDTMGEQARPGVMNPMGNNTLAAQRSEAAALARQLAGDTSPEFAAARQTVATGREAFVDPLRRGSIGSIAGQSDVQPNLVGQTEAMFPAQPFEGQAAETARALELMGEIDPSVGGPLVRQHLARQAMEAQQQLATGDNQFGGANFAARAFGNPEQRRTVMGAIDVTAPPPSPLTFPPLNPNAPQAMPSDPMAQLVEVLQATGQRHRGGSETAFNTEAIQNLRGGNLATGVAQTATNPLGVFGRTGRWIDDLTARRNAESLADLLMANSDEFNARLTRAINRPRGANRIRAGATISAGQED